MHRSADADSKRAGARVCFDVSNGAFHLNTECASQPALKAVTADAPPAPMVGQIAPARALSISLDWSR